MKRTDENLLWLDLTAFNNWWLPADIYTNCPPSNPAGASALGKTAVVKSDLAVHSDSVEMSSLTLLNARDYQGLERQAETYRRTKAADAAGYWDISYFYRGLAMVPKEASEDQWQTRIKSLQSWVEKTPHSTTARVALARAYYEGAYRARGTGYSYSVTPAMQAATNERLSQGFAQLEASSAQREQCPEWFATAQRIAHLQSWPRKQYDEIVNAGVRTFPSYDDFHYTREIFIAALVWKER